MKIMKFGGTSVGSAQRMVGVKDLITTPERKVVVLSAMAGTTNTLVQIGEALYDNQKAKALEIIKDLEQKYKVTTQELYQTEKANQKSSQFLEEHFAFMRILLDGRFDNRKERQLLAEGEILSTHLFQFFLEEKGVKSILLDALEFVRIDENKEPDLDFITEEFSNKINQYPDNQLFITQGYICRDMNGNIDNLQRGGSDYTASLLGAAIQAEEIQIWTDIDGMHNNDPRIVSKTKRVDLLSFNEAAELAYFGAKILHPATILPAKRRNIPVRLLNTMNPAQQGTLISQDNTLEGVKAIAAKDDIIAIRIRSSRMLLAYGFLKKIFEVFDRYRKPIDMVTTSEVAVSVTIDNAENLEEIIEELRKLGTVEVDKNMTTVAIVGNRIAENTGLASLICEPLKHFPIRMISYGGGKNNVSILVRTEYKKEIMQILNTSLFGL